MMQAQGLGALASWGSMAKLVMMLRSGRESPGEPGTRGRPGQGRADPRGEEPRDSKRRDEGGAEGEEQGAQGLQRRQVSGVSSPPTGREALSLLWLR